MKRPIKFRGVDTEDGVRDTVTFTLEDLLAESENYGLVDPDSIAQLVGYDKDGREVYEDDLLVDEGGQRYYSILASEVSSRWCPNFRLDLVADGTCEFTLEQEAQS